MHSEFQNVHAYDGSFLALGDQVIRLRLGVGTRLATKSVENVNVAANVNAEIPSTNPFSESIILASNLISWLSSIGAMALPVFLTIAPSVMARDHVPVPGGGCIFHSVVHCPFSGLSQ